MVHAQYLSAIGCPVIVYPNRIIAGVSIKNIRLRKAAETFAGLLQEGATKKDMPVIYINPTEA
jgi:UDPglucose 6-dehydrogenase